MDIDNKLLIGGRWVAPSNSEVIEVRSPHDRRVVGLAPAVSKADVDLAIAAAREAFDDGPWPAMDPLERAEIVSRFVDEYAELSPDFAKLITAEMGMPISESLWRQSSTVERARHFIDVARSSFKWELSEQAPGTSRTVIRREPVGVVAAVVPWNGPQVITMQKVVPALLAGCPVILKPSLETALDGQFLAEVISRSGIPQGLISVLPADREASEYLVSHPGIDMISFTGSSQTGRRIAAIAAEKFTRIQLELGGKSAEIVMGDADLASFSENLKRSSLANTGQVCTNHTRILAAESVYGEVVERVRSVVAGMKVGDPAELETEIGPLASARQFETVCRYIDSGVHDGARVVVGGAGRPHVAGGESGFYVQPTVFADAHNKMRIAQEEIFGPVLTIIPFDDEADAVGIANDSCYGLSGGVWTGDKARGEAMARLIRTGRVRINGARPSMNAPFGGFKSSGIGREYGIIGLGEYTEYKTIAV